MYGFGENGPESITTMLHKVEVTEPEPGGEHGTIV